MSSQIIEILSPNLPLDLKQYRNEEKWCAYIRPEQPGALVSYSEAVREAIALGANGCVGFVVVEPVSAVPAGKPDYSQPLPDILSRTKRGGRK
jgi:hypothetical protein